MVHTFPSECTTKGGTASGTCASSFGVCCVFSISCGATSSANNSYAIVSSYSVSSDADPCTYTFCKVLYSIYIVNPAQYFAKVQYIAKCQSQFTEALSVTNILKSKPHCTSNKLALFLGEAQLYMFALCLHK